MAEERLASISPQPINLPFLLDYRHLEETLGLEKRNYVASTENSLFKKLAGRGEAKAFIVHCNLSGNGANVVFLCKGVRHVNIDCGFDCG